MADPTRDILDRYLVLRAQDGDERALGELITRWQPRLYRYACRLTCDSDGAWDVLQEAWVSAIRGLRRLDDAGRFRPWIYRIVTCRCADWIHRRRRQRGQPPLDDAPAPSSAANGDELTRHVGELLAMLSAGQRAVLTLYYLDDFSVGEIAEIARVPAGTVKSRLHHARQAFRELWSRDAGSPSPQSR
ncbi:MAG: RNA polymerase sigma factor [Phycisphaerae bacterium]